MAFRTDLALEAHQIRLEETGRAGELPGVKTELRERDGYRVTTVEVLDKRGEKELCKPIGRYVTLELGPLLRREEAAFSRGVQALARELQTMLSLGPGDSVLVACLGNEAVTADAVGPRTARYTVATRHLRRTMPDSFGALRSVSVVAPGVLASTGVESAELLRAAAGELRPARVLAVDALASRSLERLCSTIQLTDTGIVPGSGVGNRRAALNRQTMGVPVVALGVPTVVEAESVLRDFGSRLGLAARDRRPEEFAAGMIVTPREIDVRVADAARLMGMAIDLALHPGLTLEDVELMLGECFT